MKIIDEITNREITDPDLSVGVLTPCLQWASPEAYEAIGKVDPATGEVKQAIYDSEWEYDVFSYHVLTAEEIARREESERQAEQQELINALPDAVADLSVMVSDNAIDTTDLQDALAELSEIVSGLME